MAEFVLVLPLLIALAAGVVDLARAFSTAGMIANAAREGARYGATDPTNLDAIKTHVIEEGTDAPVTLTADDITITGGSKAGESIMVQVSLTFPTIFGPIIGVPTLTIVRDATMVIF